METAESNKIVGKMLHPVNCCKISQKIIKKLAQDESYSDKTCSE